MSSHATIEAENKALIRRWFDEVWNQGRLELVDQLRAPRAIATGLGEGNAVSEGPAPFKAFYANLHAAIPDLRVKIEDIIAEGDKVAVRLSGEGTHEGQAFGTEPTGRKIKFTCITIVRIVNGSIVEAWNNLDQLGLLTQIGLIPSSQGGDRFLTR
ncbi:MAG TPA: ester cyclase [Bryobacteraceae bacterium]|jgi:predicted ester cyclase|nr:ester cyclase [Bryobacteraceae bacterium]